MISTNHQNYCFQSPNTISRDPYEPRDSYRQYDTRNQGYSEGGRGRDNYQSYLPRHDERSLTSPSSFKRGQPSRNAYAESKNDYYGRRAGNTYASDNNWRPNDNHSDARAESREVATPTRNRREAALFGYKKVTRDFIFHRNNDFISVRRTNPAN